MGFFSEVISEIFGDNGISNDEFNFFLGLSGATNRELSKWFADVLYLSKMNRNLFVAIYKQPVPTLEEADILKKKVDIALEKATHSAVGNLKYFHITKNQQLETIPDIIHSSYIPFHVFIEYCDRKNGRRLDMEEFLGMFLQMADCEGHTLTQWLDLEFDYFQAIHLYGENNQKTCSIKTEINNMPGNFNKFKVQGTYDDYIYCEGKLKDAAIEGLLSCTLMPFSLIYNRVKYMTDGR